MKYTLALGVACVGAVSSGCASSLDSPPMLAAPRVAWTPTTGDRRTVVATRDSVPIAGGESRTEGPRDTNERAHELPAVHVVASPPPHDATPARVSATGPGGVGSVRSYRFGEPGPVVTCTVLRACVIELETREALVDDPIAGDQARWIITTARTGEGGSSTLVVVKPKACDVTTNLVLSTDRRIYDVDLDSPPCSPRDANPKRAYTRHIRFTYPNDSPSVAPGSTQSARADSARSEGVGSSGFKTPAVADSLLNRDYGVILAGRGPFRLFGRTRSAFPWRPAAIADDGAHVYVSLPETARRYPSPVLYALEADGSRTIVNYVLRDTVIVTDRVFRRGVLVIPDGKREATLVFENRAWTATPRRNERH